MTPIDRKSHWQALQTGDRVDVAWAIAFTGLALFLLLLNLGGVSLRDWDEGTRALVAREMLQLGHWWHPTLHGQPYLLKPPLMDWLVATSYRLFGIHEWSSRLPGAIASACGVPLLFALGRAIFPKREWAICAAAVYLTLLPVVRHNRLLMLDGMVITAFLLLLNSLTWLPQRRYCAIAIGPALSWMVLTKGLLAVPLTAIAAIWWGWRLFERRAANKEEWSRRSLLSANYLGNRWLWLGLLLGLTPAIAWYGSQFWHYGSVFWQRHFLSQGLDRLSNTVEGNDGPPWYYVLELMKYGWPWLMWLPGGLGLAWRQRQQPWGSLVLLGFGLYLAIVSVMGTKLPWYVMPVYPFVALAVGAQLGDVWTRSLQDSLPRWWAIALAVLAIGTAGGTIYLAISYGWSQVTLVPMGLVLTAGLAIAAGIIWSRRTSHRPQRHFIPVLVASTYVALALFFLSDLWLWELNEAFDVRPVAELIRDRYPAERRIYTSFPYSRPSLDFYCQCQVIASDRRTLRQQQERSPLLLDESAVRDLNIPTARIVGEAEGLALVAPEIGSLGSE